MLRFHHPPIWVASCLLAFTIVSTFFSCSSTNQSITADSASSTDISEFQLRSLKVDVLNPNAPLIIQLDAMRKDLTKLPIPFQDYRLKIFSTDPKPIVDRMLQPNKDGDLILNSLNKLFCDTDYRIEIETTIQGQLYHLSSPLHIKDPYFNSMQDPNSCLFNDFPILTIGSTIQGSLRVPGIATALLIELLDSDRKTLESIRPSIIFAKSSNFPMNGLAKYAFSAAANNSTLSLRFCYSYPSQINSMWHNGPQFQSASTADFATITPVSDQETLSAQVFFLWQQISGPGEYRLSFTISDPQGTGFRTDSIKSISSVENFTTIKLSTMFPQLHEGSWFFWRVDYSTTDIHSSWTRARYTTSLDDLVEIIPKGSSATFFMGDPTLSADAKPIHSVHLNQAFSLERSPMTNALLAELFNRRISRGIARIDGTKLVDNFGKTLLGLAELDYGQQFGIGASNGFLKSLPGKEQHPVIGISWYGANAACHELECALGQSPGSWRLPSEAEWEYAASAYGTGPSPWLTEIQAANCNYLRSRDVYEDLIPPFTRRGGPTVPVGYYDKIRLSQFNAQKNSAVKSSVSLARLDILGNVWEWCSDWYDERYYTLSDQTNPQGPVEISVEQASTLQSLGELPSRVVRGGAWNSLKEDISPHSRGHFPPEQTSFSIGLRLVRTFNY